MSRGAKRIIGGLVAVAVLAPAFIWWENHKKAQASAEIKADAMERMSKMGEDEAGKAYYRGLVEAHHAAAFDGAYRMGGRRRSAKFDEGKYYDQLLSLMAAQATQERKVQEAAALQVLKVSAAAAALEGESPPPAE